MNENPHRYGAFLKRCAFVLVALCCFAAGPRSFAQSKSVVVSGRIVDAQTQQPMIGAAVMVKATNIGATTDVDGRYVIGVPGPDAVLVASLLGYDDQEILVGNRTTIDFQLKESSQSVEDVVVVGYGSQKKATVTGAMSTVSAQELSKVSTPQLANALGGYMSGMVTRQTSGEPGYDAAAIFIRGLGTWNTAAPLVLVDGIERDLNLINTEEIESFSILKDASATAVYGMRGANGVILIQTKKGSIGRPRISLNIEASDLQGLRFRNYINAAEFANLMNEACTVGGVQLPWSDEEIEKFRDGSSPYLYPNVNWIDEVLKRHSFQTINTLSVSGGNETVRYYVVAGFTSQGGLFKENPSYDYRTNSLASRYNFRSNVDVNLSKNFSIELGLAEVVQDNTYPGSSSGAIFDALRWYSPLATPVTNPDGSFAGGNTSYENLNPVVLSQNSGYSKQFRSTTQGTFAFKWDLGKLVTEGLSIDGKFAYDHFYFNEVTRHKRPEVKKYLGPDPVTGEDRYNLIADETAMGYRLNVETSNRSYYYDFKLNYNRTFGRHTVGAMALFNRRDYKDLTAGSSTSNLPHRYQGFSGRVSYNFDNRYLIEGNFGYNGSENFAPGKRFGFFPAVSAGWVLSNEKFWNPKVVSYLKIRGSYGEVGNDAVGGSRFYYMSTVNKNANGYLFGDSQINMNGMSELQMGSPNATWERSRKTDVGFDLELFGGDIRLSADWFYEHRDGILLKRGTIPDIMGAQWGDTPWANIGIMENRGVDANFEAHHTFDSGFYIKADANFTFARNKIIEDDTAHTFYDYQNTRGRSAGLPLGYIAEGLFQSQEEIDNSPKQELGSYTVGDVKYRDLNNDGVINAYDRTFLGYARTPEIMYGFGAAMAYKGFDLALHFTGAAHTSILIDEASMWPFKLDYPGYNVLHEYYDNRFIPGAADNSKAKYPVVHNGTSSNNFQISSLYLHDASYLKLKTAEIGYNFPKRITARMRLEKLRIYVRGNNIFCIDDIKILDPESEHGTGGYPTQRTLSLGIQIGF